MPQQDNKQGSTFYKRTNTGHLAIVGETGHSFLQRQTTNDLNLLQRESSLVTVLASPAARILDVLLLIDDEDGIDVLTLEGRGTSTLRFLEKRIFFMDRVAIRERSDEFGQIEVFGSHATESLRSAGLAVPEEAYQLASTQLDTGEVRTINLQAISPFGCFLLIVPRAMIPPLEEHLASVPMRMLSTREKEIARLEAGFPGPLGELTEAYTPLECHLEHAISSTKGCYTGQEVIARQITYDKVTKQLVWIRGKAQFTTGMELQVGDTRVGEITSAAESPSLGPIGLAMVRTQYMEAPMACVTRSGEYVTSIEVMSPLTKTSL